MGQPLSIEYVGHSTVLVEIETIRLLTDPVLRSRVGPLRRVGGPREPPVPPDVDAILISHLHRDHLDIPTLRSIGREHRLLVPRGAATWLRGQGFSDVDEMSPGETISLGGVQVHAVHARHPGFRPPAGPLAEAIGFLIEGSRSVYFAGDTALFGAMSELAGAVDVALLPVGGWGPTLRARHHLDPPDAARAAALIRPRIAVPIHWGTYWPIGLTWLRPARRYGPPKHFLEAAAELAPDARIRVTEIGHPVNLQ